MRMHRRVPNWTCGGHPVIQYADAKYSSGKTLLTSTMRSRSEGGAATGPYGEREFAKQSVPARVRTTPDQLVLRASTIQRHEHSLRNSGYLRRRFTITYTSAGLTRPFGAVRYQRQS